MHCQWGRKRTKLPLPLGFRHAAGGGPSHSNRQRAQKFGKDRACGSGYILAAEQTDTQTDTHTYSSQYFATATANEVRIDTFLSFLCATINGE